MALKIALLDNDSAFLDGVLVPGLISLGFDVECFALARDLYRRIFDQIFDVLVLDMALPDEDGRQIARYLRTFHPEIALIALTGLRRPDEHGTKPLVDVWLTKPIDIEPLAVVLADLARRKQAKDPAANTGEKWRFDPAEGKLYAPDGRSLTLNPRERVIVEQLLDASGKIVSREQLIAALNEKGYVADSNGLDVQLHRLRQKVSRTLDLPPPSHSIRGKGYYMMLASFPHGSQAKPRGNADQ